MSFLPEGAQPEPQSESQRSHITDLPQTKGLPLQQRSSSGRMTVAATGPTIPASPGSSSLTEPVSSSPQCITPWDQLHYTCPAQSWGSVSTQPAAKQFQDSVAPDSEQGDTWNVRGLSWGQIRAARVCGAPPRRAQSRYSMNADSDCYCFGACPPLPPGP